MGGILRDIAEAASVVAAFIYGLAWIFTARFFGDFHVTPEEVGIGFAFLTVRATFVLATFMLVVSGVFLALNNLGRAGGRPAGVTVPAVSDAVRIPAAVLCMCAAVAAVAFDVPSLTKILIVGGAALGAVALLAWRGRSGRSHGHQVSFDLARAVRNIGWVFLAVAAVVVVVLPLIAADRLADDVRDGGTVNVPALPGIAGIRVERVRATTIDGEAISPSLGADVCVYHFGTASEIVVLYDSAQDLVVRVPSDRLRLEHPCTDVPSSGS